jgi:hypothetical protein
VSLAVLHAEILKAIIALSDCPESIMILLFAQTFFRGILGFE